MKSLDAESIREPILSLFGSRLDILEVFSEIESTNSYLLDQPAPPQGRFRVALADYQTEGRGRQDRIWHSPRSSGLCLSLAYTVRRNLVKLQGLTLALGIGVVKALHGLGIDEVGLKWPNDVIARDRKLGGILTESRNSAGNGAVIVAGIGLNVDLPDSMRALDPSLNQIVDLKECVDEPPSREELSVAIIESLFDCMLRFESDGFTPFRENWQEYDWLFGKRISVDEPDGHRTGVANGVDDDGALIVSTDADRRHVINGTVRLLKNAGNII